MKESTLSRQILATFAIFVISAFAVAFASNDDGIQEDNRDGAQANSEVVAYADLDVTEDEDAYALFRRLQRAAEDVCQIESLRKSRTLREFSQTHHCYQQAMKRAVEELDNDVLRQML